MKKHICQDCGIKIKRQDAKRCRKCYGKTRLGNNNVSKRKSVRLKISRKLRGIKRTLETKQLQSKKAKIRFKNPKNHPSYIDGRSRKKYYCIDCNRRISLRSGIYGNSRCNRCHSLFLMKSGITMRKICIYKNYKMKSMWEVRYAKYLDKQGMNWLYESKTFDLGNTTYTPDFYLPNKNIYIEIKGRWYKDAKQKLLKFHKLFPKIKLFIISNLYNDDKERIFPFKNILALNGLKE